MEETRPVREHMDDPKIHWKSGKPNYDLVNRKYMLERSKRHKADSLEKIVENLVKTWEMESTHKTEADDWETVDRTNFYISANGGKKYNLADNIHIGNYNMMMDTCPLYSADKETNESSHTLFKSVFQGGFPWEVLDVFSGPPTISFTWRHWGTWEGPYRDVTPTGETLEMFGSCVINVTDQLKILSIEVYYDPNPMMIKLTDFKMPDTCPFKQ